MLWRESVNAAAARLDAAGADSAFHDALALAEFCGADRHSLGAPVSSPAAARYARLVKRRENREPLQHILGKMWFRYLELSVRPGTFIVRPETELLAQEAIDELKRLVQNGRETPLAADLCAGSGAVGISLATEVPQAKVVGIELSPLAFAVAQENNLRYGNRVRLWEGDIFTLGPRLRGKCDVVAANPPYVPLSHRLSPEVLCDPPMALYGGGPDGLAFPQKTLALAADLLRPGGLAVMEHADGQERELCAYAQSLGLFSDVRTECDYTGRPRRISVRKC